MMDTITSVLSAYEQQEKGEPSAVFTPWLALTTSCASIWLNLSNPLPKKGGAK